MELKFPCAPQGAPQYSRSNRTFMELKFDYLTGVLPRAQVLIVPLWNCNQVNQSLTEGAMPVLIVPLWN